MNAPASWEILFAHAMTLIAEIAKHGRPNPFWTFGGGTALMLRYGHRLSKEIDIFVPDLTSPGFEWRDVQGYQVRLETAAEIIAKKMWHRGDRIVGRDIFDFAIVAAHEHAALMENKDFILRHADAVLRQLNERSAGLKKQFDAIEAAAFPFSFEEACSLLRDTLTEMRIT